MKKHAIDCIKMDLQFDSQRLLNDFDLAYTNFKSHQIHISSPDGNSYVFKSGDIRTYGGIKQEDFTTINKWFRGTYTEEVYNTLHSQYNICRGRFMVMDQEKRAYSYHYDQTQRLHIPIQTNDHCMFVVDDTIHKMSEPGSLYLLNTTKKHSALNLSWERRVHLVLCLKNYYEYDV